MYYTLTNESTFTNFSRTALVKTFPKLIYLLFIGLYQHYYAFV